MVSKDALNKVLDDSVSAIKNVNEKINTAKNLTDKESVAALTVTELKEQVKVRQIRVQNPGSSEIKFSDIEAVETTIVANTENVVLTDFTKLAEDIKSMKIIMLVLVK